MYRQRSSRQAMLVPVERVKSVRQIRHLIDLGEDRVELLPHAPRSSNIVFGQRQIDSLLDRSRLGQPGSARKRLDFLNDRRIGDLKSHWVTSREMLIQTRSIYIRPCSDCELFHDLIGERQ